MKRHYFYAILLSSLENFIRHMKVFKKKKILYLLSIILPLVFLSGCNKSSVTNINTIEEITSGSYIIGVPNLTYLQEQAPTVFPNAKEIRAFDDVPSAYLALKQGKIDAFYQDEASGRAEIFRGVDGVKILPGNLGESNEIVIGISDYSSVINKNTIDSCLKELMDEGILEEMNTRWVKTGDYEMPSIEVPSTGPVVKIATCGNVEPHSFYKNNELTGFDVELSRRIANKLNCQISFEVNTSYTSIIASTSSGKTDLLIANLYRTEEREKSMTLSIPYATTSAIVIVKDNLKMQGYSTLEELANKTIAYDSTSVQFENQLDKYLPNSKRYLLENTSDCVLALKNSRVDGFITDLPNAKYIEQTTEGLMILPEYLDPDQYGFALQKNSDLTSKFNEVIESFRKRNVLEDLNQKWFNDLEHPNKSILRFNPNKKYTRTIKAISTGVLAPMSYLNDKNNLIGFEVELLVMICDELNYKVEFLDCVNNFGSLLSAIDTGKADVALNCISITEERKQNIDLTNSYYDGAAVIMVKNGVYTDVGFFDRLASSFEKTFVIEQRWKMILEGMLMTLIISLAAGVLGLLLGFGICLIKKAKNKPLRKITNAICRIIQGTPIVVLLMIFYYVIFGKIDISAIFVAILAFGINFAVYSSNIMYSGFQGVDKGEEEAARAMGYSKAQAFWKVSFPQATKKFLPVLRGEFISMVKMTSVAGYISVAELTRIGDIIRSKTMEAFFPLIVIALIYFGLSELLTFVLTLLDKKLNSRKKTFKMKGVKKHE